MADTLPDFDKSFAKTGTITALNGTVQTDCDGISTMMVGITGTFVSTQTFEGSVDGSLWLTLRAFSSTGATFLGSTSATNLALRVAVGGFSQFRVRSSAYVSGTVTVTLIASPATNIVLATSENANNFVAAAVQSGIWNVSAYDSNRRTYSAAVTFNAANNATDVLTISGSATTLVRVTKISMGATKTAAGTGVIDLVKRSTANTGGTSTTLTNVPHDSNDAAATAVVTNYTANPATLGTLVGPVQADRLHFVETTKMTSEKTISWGSEAIIHKAFVLRGTGEHLCVNLRGQTFAGNEITMDITWTEE